MSLLGVLPPGPTESRLRQMAQFIREPIPYLQACQAQYGNVFTLRMLGQPPYVVVCNPADIKGLFMAPPDVLYTGEINGSIFRPVHGRYSLLTLDGDKHMQHRKLILPAFHGARIPVYESIMRELTQKQISAWQVGSDFPIFPEIREITLNIILRSIFGMKEDSARFEPFKAVFRELIATIKSPAGLATLLIKKLHINLGPLTPWAKIKRLRREVDELLYHEMRERRKQGVSERSDILSLLLQAKDEHSRPMPDPEIRDEMWSLLSAGHDTSATAMSWALYYILANPAILQRITAELKETPQRFDYLEATLKETLRMMPIVPYIARLTKQNYQLNDYLLPPGVGIIPAIYLAHHAAEHWPDPSQFSPERFLTSSEKPYTYLPFGGGIRRCIGATFAQYEMKIVLAELLTHTTLTLTDSAVPKAVRRGIVMEPESWVPVRLHAVSRE